MISGLPGAGTLNGTFSPNNAFVNTNTARTINVIDDDTFTVNGVGCTQVPASFGNAHVSEVRYNQGDSTPDAVQRRDRLRTIVHLILTSPDFTIQR